MYRKTVVNVIYQEDEFLLVRKPHWIENGKVWWDFVQGGVEKKESLEQAAKRESIEELSVNSFGNIVNTHLTQKRNFSLASLNHYPDRGYTGKKMFYILVPFTGNREDIILGDDLCDKKWCKEVELLGNIYLESINKTKQVLNFKRYYNILK